MTYDLNEIVTHDGTEECIACRAQDLVALALLPAATAWESTAELPLHAISLHGAAGLLGLMLQAGIQRSEIDEAMATLLDEMERHLAEDKALGGPPQGSA